MAARILQCLSWSCTTKFCLGLGFIARLRRDCETKANFAHCHLQEHPAYAGLLFVINQTESFVPDRVFRHPIEEALKFLDQKSWMSMLPPEAVGYVKTKYNRDPGDVPDIEYIFLPGSLAGEGGLGATMARRSMGIPDKLFYGSYKNSLNKDSWSIWPMLMYPESRGQVSIEKKKVCPRMTDP